MPPQPIEVVEVGPRDGLQNEHKALPGDPGQAVRRARLCRALQGGGGELRERQARPTDG
jgi:hypothetical protein